MSSISSIGGMTDLDTFIYQSLATARKPIEELETSKSELRKKEQVYTDLKAKLRELNDTDLSKQLEELHEELFNLRFRVATKQLVNHRELRRVKKMIARLNTLIKERELGIR